MYCSFRNELFKRARFTLKPSGQRIDQANHYAAEVVFFLKIVSFLFSPPTDTLDAHYICLGVPVMGGGGIWKLKTRSPNVYTNAYAYERFILHRTRMVHLFPITIITARYCTRTASVDDRVTITITVIT